MKLGGALIGFGQVRHARLRPAVHAFSYGAYFLMLPMRRMQSQAAQNTKAIEFDLPFNRPGLLSFHDVDHGDGRLPEQGGALAWVTEILAREGINDASGAMNAWSQGSIILTIKARSFKPV